MRRALRWIGLGLGALVAMVLLVAGAVWWRHYPWPVTPERVSFESDVELVGALLEPAGPGPHPAIVKLSGAECAVHDRLINRLYANHFLPRGFAVLVYDKRGCGESGGDHAAAELPDLVADARAAVRYLRGRGDIQADGIGLIGGSQSGWITPEVAVEEPGVAFVINLSGPPLRWDETVRFEARNDLLAEGVDEAEIEEGLTLRARIWEYYRRAATDPELALGAEREALEAAVAQAGESDWHERYGVRLVPYDPELYAAWASTIFYDPMPWLERLDVPLLAVFGETDINVPAARSAAVLEELGADPRRDITVVVFTAVGHQLQSWRAWHRIGFLYLDEMADFAEASLPRGSARSR